MKKLLTAMLAGFSLSMWAQPFELDDISLTTRAMPTGVMLEWSGQLAPYKVQKSYNLKTWVDISYHLYKHTFEPPFEPGTVFYRVRTIRDTTPPPVPTVLVGQAGTCKQVNLSWGGVDCPSPADGCGDTLGGVGLHCYKIYRNGVFLQIVPMPLRTTMDTINMFQGATYQYTVSALDLVGNESAQSAPILVVVPPCSDQFEGAIDLTWDSNAPEEEVTNYIVLYGTVPDNLFMKKDVGPYTSTRIENLLKGVMYYFVVVAVNKYGQSDPSNVVSYVPE